MIDKRELCGPWLPITDLGPVLDPSLGSDTTVGAVADLDPVPGAQRNACKNQSVMDSVQYGPFNTYIPIRSTTIGKSRVARDPITKHTSRRSNSDIACVTSIGYPCTKASGESSTTKHRLLHASGPHPIPPSNDPNLVDKRVKIFGDSKAVVPRSRVLYVANSHISIFSKPGM
ncbi:hypothetical protein F511_28165 [Dorcoceras hygrometricum]|uniref:Uncharacterized protein n=1 Tax=Dorcoceras hygrometricum TaxID=472368 RepID=A0A2Z7CMQ3_9LAMI|nr:hypothetical protein F511_28165 [Dorcoceras hygrometricum]